MRERLYTTVATGRERARQPPSGVSVAASTCASPDASPAPESDASLTPPSVHGVPIDVMFG
jgi:hypothetical protein